MVGRMGVSLKQALLDEIEGYEDPSVAGEDAYPLHDIMVRSETRTVSEVVRRIRRGRFFLDPDFQREFVWNSQKQSKLIESCVMRIPLPVLYVAEAPDGRIVIVDGLQRLTTFVRFLDGELKLTGFGHDHPLGEKRFSDLPIQLQDRVEDTQLTLYILDKDAPQRARLDIFERVNSGVPLTRQQMRNAIFNGAGTRWISDIANNENFLKATGGSLNSKTMRDREAINRFAGFYLFSWKSYDNGDMDEFLARSLMRLNSTEESILMEIRKAFVASMRRNHKLFREHAFRRSLTNSGNKKSVINMAAFDVLSWVFTQIPTDVINMNRREIRARIVDLFMNSDFEYAVTYSTNSTKQLGTRFGMTENSLGRYMTKGMLIGQETLP